MADIEGVFRELRAIMQPYVEELDCRSDTPAELYLNTRHLQQNKRPLFFGAVQIKKRYVNFHLMPLYTDPDLLDTVSPELKNRMQEKTCFNFTEAEPRLLDQLSALTQASFTRY